MHAFSVDYRKDGKKPGTLMNRGFFIHGLPRPLLTCRLFGHKPVVDGTEGYRGPNGYESPGHRWVCCDRCGTRPDPQGTLDPAVSEIGDRYVGPYDASKDPLRLLQNPGPWPKKATGEFGGQLILGKSFSGWSVGVKVGNAGSEHTLAAHIRLHPLGALYLHTERFGTWLQRRLNPVGHQSRVVELAAQYGGIDWKLWAKRDEFSRGDPWWMRGTLTLDPRDRLFGRRRYAYEDVGGKQAATVRMPHGDDHQAEMQLERCTFGRNRRRKVHSWTVDWDCPGGIPTKPHGGRVMGGSGVKVSATSVDAGTWPVEAAVNIAAELTRTRTRYGMRENPAKETNGGA